MAHACRSLGVICLTMLIWGCVPYPRPIPGRGTHIEVRDAQTGNPIADARVQVTATRETIFMRSTAAIPFDPDLSSGYPPKAPRDHEYVEKFVVTHADGRYHVRTRLGMCLLHIGFIDGAIPIPLTDDYIVVIEVRAESYESLALRYYADVPLRDALRTGSGPHPAVFVDKNCRLVFNLKRASTSRPTTTPAGSQEH